MPEETKVLHEEITPEVEQTVEETVEETTNVETIEVVTVADGTFAEVVKNLQKRCGKIITRAVKNFNFEVLDNYTRISFTLREPVKAYRIDEDSDEWILDKSNVVFNSAYAFAGMLKEDDDLAFTANDCVINPKLMGLLAIGGTIDIIQELVPEGQEFINPFSSDPEPVTFEHDMIVNHIVGLKPGKTGQKFLEKYMDKLMDSI